MNKLHGLLKVALATVALAGSILVATQPASAYCGKQGTPRYDADPVYYCKQRAIQRHHHQYHSIYNR
jgi:hypothetical protein